MDSIINEEDVLKGIKSLENLAKSSYSPVEDEEELDTEELLEEEEFEEEEEELSKSESGDDDEEESEDDDEDEDEDDDDDDEEVSKAHEDDDDYDDMKKMKGRHDMKKMKGRHGKMSKKYGYKSPSKKKMMKKSLAEKAMASESIAKAVDVSPFLSDITKSMSFGLDCLDESVANNTQLVKSLFGALGEVMKGMSAQIAGLESKIDGLQRQPVRGVKSKVVPMHKGMGVATEEESAEQDIFKAQAEHSSIMSGLNSLLDANPSDLELGMGITKYESSREISKSLKHRALQAAGYKG